MSIGRIFSIIAARSLRFHSRKYSAKRLDKCDAIILLNLAAAIYLASNALCEFKRWEFEKRGEEHHGEFTSRRPPSDATFAAAQTSLTPIDRCPKSAVKEGALKAGQIK